MNDLSVAFVKRNYMIDPRPLREAVFADPLDQQILLCCLVALRQSHRGYLNVQAISLSAFRAFKMHMIVVVTRRGGAGFIAKGIFECPLIVKHLVNESLVQESPECPVYRYTIQAVADFLFYITVRKGVFPFQKKMQDFQS